jgi:hypothetical protein
MSKDPDREITEKLKAKEDTPEQFRNFVEERYLEWEREFGEAVEARRTASFDPRH